MNSKNSRKSQAIFLLLMVCALLALVPPASAQNSITVLSIQPGLNVIQENKPVVPSTYVFKNPTPQGNFQLILAGHPGSTAWTGGTIVFEGVQETEALSPTLNAFSQFLTCYSAIGLGFPGSSGSSFSVASLVGSGVAALSAQAISCPAGILSGTEIQINGPIVGGSLIDIYLLWSSAPSAITPVGVVGTQAVGASALNTPPVIIGGVDSASGTIRLVSVNATNGLMVSNPTGGGVTYFPLLTVPIQSNTLLSVSPTVSAANTAATVTVPGVGNQRACIRLIAVKDTGAAATYTLTVQDGATIVLDFGTITGTLNGAANLFQGTPLLCGTTGNNLVVNVGAGGVGAVTTTSVIADRQ